MNVVEQMQDAHVLQQVQQVSSQTTRESFTAEQLAVLKHCIDSGMNREQTKKYFHEKTDRILTDSAFYRFKSNPTTEPKTRAGAPQVMSDAAEQRVLKAFKTLRTYGTPVNVNVISSIAIGISLFVKMKGFKASRKWTEGFIERHGLHYRSRTTNRIVSFQSIYEAGTVFYKDLREYFQTNKTSRKITLNVDEFFTTAMAGGGANKTWTETDGAQTTVAVKETKVGFTCSITTSADGKAHLLQFIFKGQTDEVHAAIPDNLNVLQCHRPTSHFQDANTWKQYCERLDQIVLAIKAEDPELADVTPVLIVDCASQHYETKLHLPGWRVFAIPPKMTHIFQPANQFIISGIRANTRTAYSKLLQDKLAVDPDCLSQDFKVFTGDGAAARRLKAELTYEAFKNLSEDQVRESWRVTGVPKYLFGDTAPIHNDYDVAAEKVLKDRQGHVEVKVETRPNSKDDDDDAESEFEECHEFVPASAPQSQVSPTGGDLKRLRIENPAQITPTQIVNAPASQKKVAMTAAERKRKQREAEKPLRDASNAMLNEHEKISRKLLKEADVAGEPLLNRIRKYHGNCAWKRNFVTKSEK